MIEAARGKYISKENFFVLCSENIVLNFVWYLAPSIGKHVDLGTSHFNPRNYGCANILKNIFFLNLLNPFESYNLSL